MVGRWGMSPAVGPVTVLPPQGQESPFGDGVAPETRELVDREVRRIVDECHDEAIATLIGHRAQLDRLAHTLLEKETLDEEEAYAAAGVQRETAPGALARGDVPGVAPEPGIPPQTAGTGREGLPVSGSQAPSGSPSSP
jgi:cell division protease FtsH